VTLLVAWAGLVAWAYWPGPAEVPVEQLAVAEDRFADVDGLRLRWRSWGEPAAGLPNLLLLHGFANSLQSFRTLGPALAGGAAGGAHVVAVDMPGFGLSAKPAPHDYSNAAQAAVVRAFARAIGLDSYVVVGHSLGGAVAEHLALQAPEVTGLVLLNPGILSTGVGAFGKLSFFPMPRVSARMFGDRDFRAMLLRKSYVDPSVVTEQVVDELMLGARAEGYLAGMSSMMGQYAEGREVALLARLRVPTLIVWGVQDRNKPAGESRQLQSLISGSRLVEVAHAGHYVHEEAPAEVAAAIRDDLARLAAPRPVDSQAPHGAADANPGPAGSGAASQAATSRAVASGAS
jgi:pimeloyl-ACP methyl ester carboxylesterase